MIEQEKNQDAHTYLENNIHTLCEEGVSKKILLPEFSSEFLSSRSILVLNSILNGIFGSSWSSSHIVFLRSVLENRFKPDIQKHIVSIIDYGANILDAARKYPGKRTDPEYRSILLSFREKTDSLKEIFPQGWLLENGKFVICNWGGHTGEQDELNQIDQNTSLPFRLGRPSSLPIKECSEEQRRFISAYLQKVSSKPVSIENQWFEKEEI